MRVEINKAQDRALNGLRGLPPDAHMLVMCSRRTATGAVLDGSEAAFVELVEFISGELAEGMQAASSTRALWSLCVAIDPDCADWLGM